MYTKFFTNRYHLQLPTSRSTRQYHPLHYILPHVSTTAHQDSYFSKTINDWNSLPVDLIEIADADIFRTTIIIVIVLHVFGKI